MEIYLTQHPTETESKENTYICLHCKSFFNPKPEICPECGHKTFEITHPSSNPLKSKGQELEVDLLVDAARYFDCKKINIPGIYSGSYIDKIDFFVFADRLTKENKELREALANLS